MLQVLALLAGGVLGIALFAQSAKDFIYVGGKLVAVEIAASGGSSPYLDVLPATATLSEGQSLNLTAELFNDGANSGDKTATALWEIVSGPGAVSAGLYTAPSSVASSVNAIVRATSSGYSDTATLTVNPAGTGGHDLSFNYLNGTSSPVVNISTQYSFEVQNSGPDTSGAFTAKFYTRVGGTDTEIPNSTVAFGSQPQGSVSATVNLSFGSAGATILVGKIIYSGSELSTSNNEITKSIVVQSDAGTPDIDITGVVVMPSAIPVSGQDVEVAVSWKNIGLERLTAHIVYLHASQTQGATLTTQNRVGQSPTFVNSSSIDPGQSKTYTFDLGNPNWAAGTWYITARIEMAPDEYFKEESAIVSNSQFPDFYLGSFGISPFVVQPGQWVDFSAGVHNNSTVSGPAYVRYWLSDDNVVGDDVHLLDGDSWTVPSGSPGFLNFPVVNRQVSAPAPGYYYLIAQTVPDGTFDGNSFNDFSVSASPFITVFTNVSVGINPPLVTLGPGQSQTFNTSVTGSPDPSVTWIIESAGGAALNGTIDSNGFYLAPSSIGAQRDVTLRATTSLPPAYPASTTATVTLVPSLNGTPPVVSLTATGQPFDPPADVTLTATASDPDGTITKVEFLADGVLLNTDTTAPYEFLWAGVPSAQYSVVARAHDNDGFYADSTPITVRVEDPAFLEQSGLVVMEAEKGLKIAGTTHSWAPTTSIAGYSGSEYLLASPDSGHNQNTGYVGVSPEVQLPVTFSTTGTYYVWVRGSAPAGGGNSLHVGLDGAAVATSDRMEIPDGSSWAWTNSTMDAVRASLVISSAGTHSISAWMREDGFRLDRILLTTDPNYTPTGLGPSESPAGNQAPVLQNPGTQSGVVGVAASLTLSATDLESDPITFGATGLPSGLSINAMSGAITGTPSSIGSYSVTATATAAGDTDVEVFQWNIAANQPPVLNNPGTQATTIGMAVSLQLNATDPESDPITYGATGLPPGLSVNVSGLISGTVTTLGSYSVNATASAAGGVGNQPFTWNVVANQPPVLTNPGAQLSGVGGSVSLTLSATDPEMDPITYSATGLPPGLSINSGSGAITGVPTTAGSYSVTATATATGGFHSQPFTWDVSDDGVFISTPVDNAVLPSARIPLTWTAQDAAGIQGCELQIDSGPQIPYSNCPNGTPASTVLSYVHGADSAKFMAYDLSEGAGTTTEDRSVGASLGILTGSPVWGVGPFGANLVFDGSNDWISPDSPSSGLFHNAFTERTFEAWIKADSVSGAQTIYDEGGSTHGLFVGLSANQLTATVQASQTKFTRAATFTDIAGWHHVAVVFDDGVLTLYLDGQSVASGTASFSSIPSHTDQPGIGKTEGGTGDDGASGRYFDGMMDEIAIYNRALSGSEVSSHYAGNFLNDGSHTITVSATNTSSATTTDSVDVYVVAATGAFVESSGMVAMDAPSAELTSGTSNTWTPSLTVAGHSGDYYLEANPDAGTTNNTGYTTSSPRASFPVNFTTTGTYYVWVRATTPSNGESVHVGLDGAAVSTSDRISLPSTSSWTWTNDTMDSVRASLVVSSAGTHTIDVWMREDGFRFDRVLLTTNSNYTPTGVGPAESAYTSPVVVASTGGGPEGLADPNWLVNGGTAYVLIDGQFPFPPWLANSVDSSWVSPHASYASSSNYDAPGTYTYSTTFDLGAQTPSTASITFVMAADDEVTDVKINGVSTGLTVTGFASFSSPMTISSGFVTGTNTLEFVTTNGGSSNNPTGLRVEFQY